MIKYNHSTRTCCRGLAVALSLAFSAPALASKAYEVWVSDQTNSAGISGANDIGTHGGLIRIYDSSCLEAKSINCPLGGSLVIDVANWASAIGMPTRLHGMLPSPNHNYLNVNFVATGHLAIIDARTKTVVALFRSTGTTTGRQNHMSFWSPDGKHLLVSNQSGKLLERINISWDASGDNITAAVWDKTATLDLAGDMTSRLVAGQDAVADSANYPLASVAGSYATQSATTPNGLPKQDATLRPNNTDICPITGSEGKAYVTLGGGGMFVVDYTATPMAIVAEYDQANMRAAGCGGIESGGEMYMNTGTPGPDISEFTVYRFPLSYPDAPGFNLPNTPTPEIIYADPDNGLTIPGNNRDAHGMTVTKNGKYLHQFDRVRNNVEVFNTKHLTHYTYWLTTANGADPALGAPAGTACGTTLGASNSNDPAPDLLDLDPRGKRIYVALRGPFPLSVTHAAVGSCPGLGIVELQQDGRSGVLTQVLPTFLSNFAGTKNISDPHGVAVRLK